MGQRGRSRSSSSCRRGMSNLPRLVRDGTEHPPVGWSRRLQKVSCGARQFPYDDPVAFPYLIQHSQEHRPLPLGSTRLFSKGSLTASPSQHVKLQAQVLLEGPDARVADLYGFPAKFAKFLAKEGHFARYFCNQEYQAKRYSCRALQKL